MLTKFLLGLNNIYGYNLLFDRKESTFDLSNRIFLLILEVKNLNHENPSRIAEVRPILVQRKLTLDHSR